VGNKSINDAQLLSLARSMLIFSHWVKQNAAAAAGDYSLSANCLITVLARE